MKYEDFDRTFKSQTTNLSWEKQLSLSVSICKKLFYDYQKFSERNDWGDPDLLLDAINLAEKSLSHNRDMTAVTALLQKVNEITPDTEDFVDASYALNACTAVYETLEFTVDSDPTHIYNIGRYLTDTIDFKIRESDHLTQDQIDKHPLMIETRQYLIEATR